MLGCMNIILAALGDSQPWCELLSFRVGSIFLIGFSDFIVVGMRKHITLFLNGSLLHVDGDEALLTLSEYLRIRRGLTGTKIVCSEGDCGSCSVLCGKLDESDKAFKYVSIDSCIRFMFQLDGCHVVTVEGLAGPQAAVSSAPPELTSVQQAMVDCHGSQCGFCTPGFVMAMTGILESADQPDEETWRCGLSGNLCRCTGYTSIVAAAQQANQTTLRRMNEIYPPEKMLEAARTGQSETVEVVDGDQIVFCPTTIKEATEFLAKHPDATIVAGATDMGVRFNKGHLKTKTWLDLNKVDELSSFEISDGAIVAGARATWSDFEDATAETVPEFHNIVSVFGSPQIRHVGTIGGNLINASPIADSIPFLSVCEAEMTLVSDKGARVVNINDFYTGYKQFDLKPGELLSSVRVPLPEPAAMLRLYKVSRRHDMDISTFTAAILISTDGDQITSASIAYGAVGPVVLRLPKTEAFLVGRALDQTTMVAAGEIAVGEITPLSDVRGGKDFRLQLAKNVLLKFVAQANAQSTGEVMA